MYPKQNIILKLEWKSFLFFEILIISFIQDKIYLTFAESIFEFSINLVNCVIPYTLQNPMNAIKNPNNKYYRK